MGHTPGPCEKSECEDEYRDNCDQCSATYLSFAIIVRHAVLLLSTDRFCQVHHHRQCRGFGFARWRSMLRQSARMQRSQIPIQKRKPRTDGRGTWPHFPRRACKKAPPNMRAFFISRACAAGREASRLYYCWAWCPCHGHHSHHFRRR
jgi:hypothetical protein